MNQIVTEFIESPDRLTSNVDFTFNYSDTEESTSSDSGSEYVDFAESEAESEMESQYSSEFANTVSSRNTSLDGNIESRPQVPVEHDSPTSTRENTGILVNSHYDTPGQHTSNGFDRTDFFETPRKTAPPALVNFDYYSRLGAPERLRSEGLHRRNLSNMTTGSTNSTSKKYNKRFSVQPHTKSPTRYDSHCADEDTEVTSTMESNDRVGEEPGVNVRTMSVDLPDSRGSQVTVIDYSAESCQISHYDVEKNGGSLVTGSSDPRMLNRSIVDVMESRPKWGRVRWVVVNGLSWEAIQPIALHYNLHPLAVEDMLDIPQRIKMEVFQEQIFCCFPLHLLHTTPTPYSFFKLCTRQIILKLVWIFKMFVKILTTITRAVIYLCVWNKKPRQKSDLENHASSIWENDKSSVPNFGKPPNRSSSSYSSKGPTSFAKNSTHWDVREVNLNNSSSTTIDGISLSDSYDQCIPFYTLNQGILCGDAESSPIAAALRELPARSIYEWNRGNLALKREALQNMHIAGSSNSFEIALEQVSVFLVGDTVITFFEKSAPAIYRPLEDRLRSHSTMLRQSSDPAILMQAILDASVDLIGPILNEYRSRLNQLQIESVDHPNLQHTRALHAFITDLTVLRPPLSSLSIVIEALWSKSIVSRKSKNHRSHGLSSKSASDVRHAKYTTSSGYSGYSHGKFPGDTDGSSRKVRITEPKESPGMAGTPKYTRGNTVLKSAISDVAALYFGDVADHALRYLQDLDDMRSQSKTLSSLIFNTISIRASDSVKMLSLVSVVFLPLTFLTGYFGMNFKTFTILDHDVGYYWIVATPAAAALSAFLMYPSVTAQIQEMWSWAKSQV